MREAGTIASGIIARDECNLCENQKKSKLWSRVCECDTRAVSLKSLLQSFLCVHFYGERNICSGRNQGILKIKFCSHPVFSSGLSAAKMRAFHNMHESQQSVGEASRNNVGSPKRSSAVVEVENRT